jgi:hypothetical protein
LALNTRHGRIPPRLETRLTPGWGNLSEYDVFYISKAWLARWTAEAGQDPYPASARFAASAKNPEA